MHCSCRRMCPALQPVMACKRLLPTSRCTCRRRAGGWSWHAAQAATCSFRWSGLRSTWFDHTWLCLSPAQRQRQVQQQRLQGSKGEVSSRGSRFSASSGSCSAYSSSQ